MKTLTNLLLSMIFLFYPLSLTANTETKKEQPKINRLEQLAIDYATCAAYFLITAESGLLSNDEIVNNKQLSDKALQNSSLFNGSNHPEEPAKELTRKYYQQAASIMLIQLGGDFSKAYLLDGKHQKSCNSLMKDPETSLQKS